MPVVPAFSRLKPKYHQKYKDNQYNIGDFKLALTVQDLISNKEVIERSWWESSAGKGSFCVSQVAWVSSPDTGKREEKKMYSIKMVSDFHMLSVACKHPRTHTHKYTTQQ